MCPNHNNKFYVIVIWPTKQSMFYKLVHPKDLIEQPEHVLLHKVWSPRKLPNRFHVAAEANRVGHPWWGEVHCLLFWLLFPGEELLLAWRLQLAISSCVDQFSPIWEVAHISKSDSCSRLSTWEVAHLSKSDSCNGLKTWAIWPLWGVVACIGPSQQRTEALGHTGTGHSPMGTVQVSAPSPLIIFSFWKFSYKYIEVLLPNR
jgi:hypothetical protein